METKNIKAGENRELIIDTESSKKEFESRQVLLELIVHAADVSTQVRPFDVALQWTWLLFEEFFDQGDREKEEKLPISFLCDRTTTSISASQPGFMNFIVVPLFTAISDLTPTLKILEENAKTNARLWTEKVETDQEKKIYLPRNGKDAGDGLDIYQQKKAEETKTQIPKQGSK